MKFVVDTHALIWFLAGDSRLSVDAHTALSAPDSELMLPAIVVAEACWIVEHKPITLTAADVMTSLDIDPRMNFLPLTREVIECSSSLTTIVEMHDRQIVSTTLLLIEAGERVALVTRDINITASGLVPVVW
jgi:PIN domain nuclease of toxin-antitoxin system